MTKAKPEVIPGCDSFDRMWLSKTANFFAEIHSVCGYDYILLNLT